ncbi:MAG: hypothetical protein ACR2RV_13030, partial [Verrucomicrobiales bacterium]
GWATDNRDAGVKGSAACTGSSGVELRRATWIETQVSTVGYHSIRLKYTRMTTQLDAGEFLFVEWWDGDMWREVESTSDGNWDSIDVRLPNADELAPGADDNAEFRIRFRLESNDRKEKARIDDVEISGTPN